MIDVDLGYWATRSHNIYRRFVTVRKANDWHFRRRLTDCLDHFALLSWNRAESWNLRQTLSLRFNDSFDRLRLDLHFGFALLIIEDVFYVFQIELKRCILKHNPRRNVLPIEHWIQFLINPRPLSLVLICKHPNLPFQFLILHQIYLFHQPCMHKLSTLIEQLL